MRPPSHEPGYFEPGSEGEPQRRPTRARYPLVLAVLGVLMLIASVVGAVELGRLNSSVDQLVERISQRSVLAARIKQEFLLLRVAEKNIILEETQSGMDLFEGRATTARSRMLDLLNQLKGLSDDQVDPRLSEFDQNFREYDTALGEVMRQARANTLQRAAELSRGHGRTLYDLSHEFLGSIVKGCAGSPGQPAGAGLLPAIDAMNALHELAYIEQAALTTFSKEQSQGLLERDEQMQSELLASLARLRDVLPAEATGELEALTAALDAWSQSRRQVHALAGENSKARAMEMSNTALRQAYLRSAEQLDSIVLADEQAMHGVQVAHSKTIAMGRALLLVTGLLGLSVALGLVVMVLGQLLRELRRASDSISLEA